MADLRTVLQLPGLEIPERGRALDALRRFETTALDWADCVLLSYLPDRTVYTFGQQMIQQGAQQPNDDDRNVWLRQISRLSYEILLDSL